MRAADAVLAAEMAAANARSVASKQRVAYAPQPPPTATALPTTSPGMQLVRVVVPVGVGPGHPFRVSFEGAAFQVTCPAGGALGRAI